MVKLAVVTVVVRPAFQLQMEPLEVSAVVVVVVLVVRVLLAMSAPETMVAHSEMRQLGYRLLIVPKRVAAVELAERVHSPPTQLSRRTAATAATTVAARLVVQLVVALAQLITVALAVQVSSSSPILLALQTPPLHRLSALWLLPRTLRLFQPQRLSNLQFALLLFQGMFRLLVLDQPSLRPLGA
jgi:hypothetical protein